MAIYPVYDCKSTGNNSLCQVMTLLSNMHPDKHQTLTPPMYGCRLRHSIRQLTGVCMPYLQPPTSKPPC